MNLYFCDLCNESIPQADLDLGRAVRRGERLICVACEAAMSSGPDPATAPVIPNVAPRVESGASNSSSSIAAVALAFASVALISGIGAGAYFFWRLERETQISREQIADLEHAAPEHARTVSAALTDEAAARETEAAATRAALQALSERVQELEQADPAATALERRIDNLDARLGAFDDLASRVQHQGGVLDQLTAAMAEATDAKASAPAPAAPAPQEAARPAAPPPSASAPGGALWEKWIADLKSPDSGTRWQAVQSLGGTRDPSVVPHLVPMLKDADIFVRMAACRHLDELGSVEAIPALIDALEDEEAIVREAALAALRSLSGQALPFDPNARDGDRSKRVKAWRDWWEGASKELLARGKSKPAKS